MSSFVQGTPEALEGYGNELAAPMLELRAWAAYFAADRCPFNLESCKLNLIVLPPCTCRPTLYHDRHLCCFFCIVLTVRDALDIHQSFQAEMSR